MCRGTPRIVLQRARIPRKTIRGYRIQGYTKTHGGLKNLGKYVCCIVSEEYFGDADDTVALARRHDDRHHEKGEKIKDLHTERQRKMFFDGI